MIDVMYLMTEDAVNSFVQFKTDLEKLRAIATPEQIQGVKASVIEMQTSTGQHFTVDEEARTAIIKVSGKLTPRPEICVSLHDGSQTIYSTIVESIAQAELMPTVEKIRIEFDTPGGYADGIEKAALAIKQCKKPTEGIVTGMACSGGFWLLSMCDTKIAATPLAQVGSIGVIVEAIDRSAQDKESGIKRYVLTSKNAPDKFNDIGTEKGRKGIVNRINDIERVFIKRVAEGFGISEETVLNDFGKGGVLIAEDALKVGMIEKIDEGKMNSIESVKNGDNRTEDIKINKKNSEEVSMSLKELLNQNPEAKAEYEASKIAVASDERARISKLMKLSGVVASEELYEAIESGVSTGDYAEAQLSAQNAARLKASNISDIGKIKPNAQTPKDTDVEDDNLDSDVPDDAIISEDQAKAAAKNFYGGDS